MIFWLGMFVGGLVMFIAMALMQESSKHPTRYICLELDCDFEVSSTDKKLIEFVVLEHLGTHSNDSKARN